MIELFKLGQGACKERGDADGKRQPLTFGHLLLHVQDASTCSGQAAVFDATSISLVPGSPNLHRLKLREE